MFIPTLRSARFILSVAMVFSVLAFAGCKPGTSNFDKKIIQYFQAQCHQNSPCVVEVRNLTNFEWDTMYAFDYRAQKVDVEEVVHRKITEFREFSRTLIFTRNGDIVLISQQPAGIEKPLFHEVEFDVSETSGYKAYPANVRFRITEVKDLHLDYFFLKQIP